MAITLGGIMRGALPTATQFLTENIPQNAEDRIANLNEKYTAMAKDFLEKEKTALAENNAIKTIAKNLGVDAGIAKQAYQLSGGKIDKASKIINNMLAAFPKGLPVTRVEEPKPIESGVSPIKLDEIDKVDIAPKGSGEESIFNSFKNLFKYYSNDEVVKMFSNRSGIPEAQVRKTLAGTFKLPELETKFQATPSAIAAGLTTASSDKPSRLQEEINAMKLIIRNQPGNQNLSDDEITKLATEAVVNPARTLQSETVQVIYTKDGPRSIPVKRTNIEGQTLAPTKEIEETNKEILTTNYGNLGRINNLRNVIAKYPNAFNVIGQTQLVFTDFADFFGADALSQFFGGKELQSSIQDAILFFKGAKDSIFKDPRISDQDKALIERYLGILNSPTIGESRALAAIAGLERQFITSMANAIAINNGAGKSGGISVIEKTDAGVIDINKDSVAKRVFDQIVKAQGLDVVSADVTMKRKVAQAMMLAQNSVGAFEASLSQPETYKTKYKNKFITVAGLQ